eukprot:m.64349 g.64349  ORF g.64349 m.64349 type:complete len:1290 (+) comp19542_c0_seq1:69-3938(+)
MDNPHLAFWKQKLDGAATLQLPFDFPRPDTLQFVEGEETIDLSEKACRGIVKRSMNDNTQPFTVVLAAYYILLHKYTREENIVIGSSSSAFNPLAIRVDVKDDATLDSIVTASHQALEEAEQHEIPYDEIFDALRPAEGNDVASLFQVRVFNVSDVNTQTLDAARCDWTIYVEQDHNSKRLLPLRLRIIFNTTLFSRDRMQDVLRQCEMVLNALCESPEQKVGETSICTEESQSTLPDPTVQLDTTWEGAIHDILTKKATEHPEKPFVIHGKRVFTYKDIEERSNRVANFLVKNGIQPEERVALYAHRSTALVAGIMGILKSGATFTVVDPAYPVERQIIYLKVAQPRAVVTLAAAGELHSDVQSYIDTELDLRCQLSGLSLTDLGPLSSMSVNPPGVVVGPDSIGTLSFTSGSTGLPKAVRGRHVSLSHFYPWMSQEFGIGPDDRFSMLSGIAHDPIQRDVFTPIFFGAEIHIPDAEDIGNPGQLAKWVAEHKITITHLTPAMGQLLTANASTQMPSLATALFVGDVLTKRDIRRLQQLAPNVVAVNMYGTTETQRAVSFLKITHQNIDRFKEILPSGRGMKDVQLLVLSRAGIAGIGELGEIYVRSPHMSAGYLKLPDATNAKFLTNWFTKVEGDRFYRTGDLGRYMPDGIVECIGRADDQVKIRGFRIELGEIDTHLGQHPHVRENKTLVLRDANEEKQLISFFVPTTKEYDIEGIREYLSEKLPVYSIPSVFCPLTRMPLTPNGKIDKNRLPFPDTATILAQQRNRAPPPSTITPLQKQLMDIWEEVLGRPVLPTDNFFHVGGHSILATRLTFSMRSALKQDLPLNLLYQYPTISQISQAIESTRLDPSLEMPTSGRETAEVLDLKAEVVLDESITLGKKRVGNLEDPSGIVLTGATGFLGAFILMELLEKFPKATVRCLVRAKALEQARERVVDNLRNHMLWKEDYGSRVVAFVGDLSLARWGLTEAAFRDLADKTDIIFHNGAMVHWVYPYSRLKPMNVSGTVQALQLAVAGKKVAAVHFISSTSVFDSPHYMQHTTPVAETDPMDEAGGAGLTVGYGQSKWVAEKILLLARSRGLPITIFRPGYVVGESKTGIMNIDDFLVRLLKGCIQLGKAPSMRNTLNMCSVDFVARSIVHAATQKANIGKAFHIVNPHTFRFTDFFSALTRYGYDVKFEEYLTWRDSLMNMTLATKNNALYPLLHFVLDDLPTRSKSPALDSKQLMAAIEGSGIECHPIQNLMGIFLSYLVHCGYISKPTKTGGEVEPLPQLNLDTSLTAVLRSDRKM